MSALVLKKFDVNPEAEAFVDIEGRQGGLLSFLLNLAGIDSTVTLRCTATKIEYKAASWKGFSNVTIPLQSVSAIVTGLKKPIELLIAAVAIFIASISAASQAGIAALGVGLVISVILVGLYILKKEMALGVMNGGDTVYGLSFKRSVIEGVTVDNEKVNQAVDLINAAVLAQNSK